MRVLALVSIGLFLSPLVEAACLLPPIGSPVVTSVFGPRMHPVEKRMKIHRGMDFRAGIGTQALAVSDGVVSSFGWSNHGGNTLVVKNADGSSSYYMHLRNSLVNRGDPVRSGQVVALTGNTSDYPNLAPHLHFALLDVGKNVIDYSNPLPRFCAPPSLKSGAENPGGAAVDMNESAIAGHPVSSSPTDTAGKDVGYDPVNPWFSEAGAQAVPPNFGEYDGMSFMDVMATETNRRLTNPGWYDALQQMRSAGLLRELTHQFALSAWIEYHLMVKRESVERLMAKLIQKRGEVQHEAFLAAASDAAAKQAARK